MKTPEQKARDAERVRRWKKAHPERTKQLCAESRARHPRQYTPEQRAAAVVRTLDWAEKNPERAALNARISARNYAVRNPEKIKQRFRDYILRTKYDITWEQYHAMLDAQDSKCAICKTETPGGRGAFPVDHNHQTGKIRGLLCNGCNIAIGILKDNPTTLRAAATYLETHNLTMPD